MKYRPDIDGIRAIAVLLVLFYHAHFSLIASGFIGVDVFFVISGFLISNIILQEINRSQSLQWVHFYRKRLWRLAPVFIALLAVTMVVSWVLYLPDDLMNFTGSAKNAAYFNANYYFDRTTNGYFSQNINYIMLLHTWSLAVEWQWYLILPFLLYGLHRYAKAYACYCMWGLTMIALSYTLISSYYFSGHSYYQLSTRICELLIGSSLALMPERILHSLRQIKNMDMIAPFVGFLALISLIYLATRSDILVGFPNIESVAICVVTALLIFIGQLKPENLCTRALSLKPLVWVGLLSYSLYIWHWPIFSVVRYLNIIETAWVTSICLVLAFILAFISWYYLEKPARQLSQISLKWTLIGLFLLPIIATQLIHDQVKKNKGYPRRFGETIVKIEASLANYHLIGREKCMTSPQIEQRPVYLDADPDCQLGETLRPKTTALMIGDSFANHYFGFMNVLAKDAQMRVQSNTTAGCLAVPNIYLFDWLTKRQVYQECHDNTLRYYQNIQQNNYDYVILAHRLTGYLGDKVIQNLNDSRSDALSLARIQSGFEAAIDLIIASGAIPVLIEETVINLDDNACFYQPIKSMFFKGQDRDWMTSLQSAQQQCNRPFVLSQKMQVLASLYQKLQMRYPSLIIIDPKRVQCPNGICVSAIEGVPIFSYGGHINDFASTKLGEYFLKQYQNPLRTAD